MNERVSATASGRIPFRIRIGVVGHRELAHEERLTEVVREQVMAISNWELWRRVTGVTPVELAIVSALAKGADRIVVREVLAEARSRGKEARLEVILPMERDAYAADQRFAGTVLDEYRELLAEATVVDELATGQAASRYKHAGQGVVNRCDVLVALWNGGPSGGEGGSAESLLFAAARWRPCIWISTTEGDSVRHNLGPGTAADFLDEVRRRANVAPERADIGEPQEDEPDDVRAPLAKAYEWFCRFNGESLPSNFSQQLERELATPIGDDHWVVEPHLRATLAASRWQRWFARASWTIAGLATLTAVVFAVSRNFHLEPEKVFAWLDFGLLIALLAVFLVTHWRLRMHERWLAYRLLAERLRSARYLAPTGVNFRRVAGSRGVFVEQQSADWVQRAFEEVWDSRPSAGPAHRITNSEADTLKSWLVDDWIDRQIDYHRGAGGLHERRARLSRRAIIALFVLTLVAAFTRSVLETVGGPRWILHLATTLAVVLPVAAASVGAILTIRQHRALAERFRRMRGELAGVRTTVLEADKDSLQHASSSAAQVIAEETGDWFGAMWFLDIEYP